jgi:YVTN family beta-propeller protein
VITTISVGSEPYAVAITPNGAYAYITNADSNSVSVVNLATNTVTETLTVGAGPYGVAVTPSGAYVYISNDVSNTVWAISTGASGGNKSPTTVGEFPTSATPSLVLTPLIIAVIIVAAVFLISKKKGKNHLPCHRPT